MRHGTISAHARGCRCGACREARREYDQGRGYGLRRSDRTVNRELLGEALREMFPLGLTDDCPARDSAVKLARGCDSCSAPARLFYDGRRWLCASCWRETHGADPPHGGVVRA